MKKSRVITYRVLLIVNLLLVVVLLTLTWIYPY